MCSLPATIAYVSYHQSLPCNPAQTASGESRKQQNRQLQRVHASPFRSRNLHHN